MMRVCETCSKQEKHVALVYIFFKKLQTISLKSRSSKNPNPVVSLKILTLSFSAEDEQKSTGSTKDLSKQRLRTYTPLLEQIIREEMGFVWHYIKRVFVMS